MSTMGDLTRSRLMLWIPLVAGIIGAVVTGALGYVIVGAAITAFALVARLVMRDPLRDAPHHQQEERRRHGSGGGRTI